MPTLYLIPTPIADDGYDHIPPIVKTVSKDLSCFIVERLRTARRFLRTIHPTFDIDGATFIELDKHHDQVLSSDVKSLLKSGHDIGLLSEAGLPCVADPGEEIVDYARNNGYIIKPLSGPSSIFMALMASGLNSEQFTFHGYLPIKDNELKKQLKSIERPIQSDGYTQLFIETPYRNMKVFDQIINTLHPSIRLCIARHISSVNESIATRTIAQWKKARPKIGKEPCLFLLGR